MKRKSAVFRAIGAGALLALGTLHAFGQQIPASSADSGRRAVIAVNQGTIYNNINNAQNSANNAWNYANNAQNTANAAYYNDQVTNQIAQDARRRAEEAASAGGGFATGIFRIRPGNTVNSPTWQDVACVYNASGPTTVRRQYNPGEVPPGNGMEGWVRDFTCPPGSAVLVFTNGDDGVDSPGGNGGDSGGGGGGGSG